MTNSIIDSGSSIAVLAVIKNGSTNAIQVADTGGKTDFDFFLTKGAGKLYDLTPTSDLNHLRKLVTINAGEQSASTIPVPFGKNLAPGDYTLKATRFIFTKKGTFTLESNPLKVRVK